MANIENCPECGKPMKRANKNTDKKWKCVNPDCPRISVKR
jgi:hypothetical protein